MKSKETWTGMLTAAFGSYLCYQAFGNESMVVSNIIDQIKEQGNSSPDPEKVRHILLAFKGIVVSIVTMGAVLTVGGVMNRKREVKS